MCRDRITQFNLILYFTPRISVLNFQKDWSMRKVEHKPLYMYTDGRIKIKTRWKDLELAIVARPNVPPIKLLQKVNLL